MPKTFHLDLEPLNNHLPNKDWPILLAGPCSAESETQVITTAKELAKLGKVSAFRAGIWKPRTRPGSFEGIGEPGLPWLKTVKQETGLQTATEIATLEHVEACLKYDVDILWIGARTAASPFAVQNLADVLKGVDITVLIKNPVNPDLQLWMGALERINKAGIKRLGVIHRGFSANSDTVFRNEPMWSFPIELKSICPNLPIITDPSHIAGKRELISFISQKALDLDMDGLMIESHISPDEALSDAQQQVTPKQLDKIIKGLILRSESFLDKAYQSLLDELREKIDDLDQELIQKLSSRMKIAAQIGEYKRDNQVKILQMNRWESILDERMQLGMAMGLNENFVKKMLQLIHQESISIQTEIMNKKKGE